MGETTEIQWTHRPGTVGGTWNPWQGCVKKSEGCEHCYMYRDKARFGKDPTVVVRSSPATFNMPLKQATPHTLFTCSWSDFFNKEADAWRADAWEIMRKTPQHTYLVLTKLHARIRECLPADWGQGWPNVWLGVSAENQKWADIRVPKLLDVPAAVHFVSAEPLLGPIDFGRIPYQPDGHVIASTIQQPTYLDALLGYIDNGDERRIDWLIVGGESGPAARPMHPEWARALRNRCNVAFVSFFFKQWGEWAPMFTGNDDPTGHTLQALTDGTITDTNWNGGSGPHLKDAEELVRAGKKAAGDVLDGRTWHEFPREVPIEVALTATE